MKYQTLISFVLIALFAGCATQRKFTGKKQDLGTPPEGYKYQLTKLNEPSGADPFLSLKVERQAVKRLVKKEYQLSRSLGLSQWLLVAGAAGALGATGVYEMDRGYVVLGRDLIGVGAAIPLGAFLYSQTGKRTAWQTDSVKVFQEWQLAPNLPIIAEIKKHGLRQELRTNQKAFVSVDLKAFAEKAPQGDDILWVGPADSPTLGKGFRFTEKLKREILGEKPPVVIALLSPKQDTTVYGETLILRGDVSSKNGIRELRIWVNERTVSLNQRGIEIKKSDHWQFSACVPLVANSENIVKLEAIDEKGFEKELEIRVKSEIHLPEIWAVVVGISAYKDSRIPDLQYADADARAVYDFLTKELYVDSSHVWLFLNEEATLTKVKTALGVKLKANARDRDQVIIYFSGHGSVEPNSASPDPDGLSKYLLLHDSKPDELYATAFPMEELGEIFSRLEAERAVYFGDTCYSGGGRIDPKIKSWNLITMRSASIDSTFLRRIAEGRGRALIVASRANEPSMELDELGHGVFTHYLLEGLRGAARSNPNDCYISVKEIHDYVSQMVPEKSGRVQHPIMKAELAPDIYLSKVCP